MAKKAQSAWSEVAEEPLAVMPPVERLAVVVADDDARVTTGARRIIKPAREAGWRVRVTYARGPKLGAAGAALRVSDSVKVRGRRGNQNFVAVWLDGSFEVAYAGPDGERPTRVSASELRARLA